MEELATRLLLQGKINIIPSGMKSSSHKLGRNTWLNKLNYLHSI
jgi:hypothetical protein